MRGAALTSSVDFLSANRNLHRKMSAVQKIPLVDTFLFVRKIKLDRALWFPPTPIAIFAHAESIWALGPCFL